MTRWTLLVGGAIVLAVARAPADVSAQPAERYWSTCTEKESADCLSTPASYVWPDSRFAIGVTLDAVLRESANQLFAKSGPAMRIGTLVTIDTTLFDGPHPRILAFEGGYRLEQFSTSDLFGETASSALTSHDVFLGATYRILSDRSLDPVWSGFARLAGGVGFGPLVLRDAASGERYEDWSAAGFVDLGAGFLIRMLGLLIEAGYEFAWSRRFEIEMGNGHVEVSRRGFYLRSGVIIHLP